MATEIRFLLKAQCKADRLTPDPTLGATIASFEFFSTRVATVRI